MRECCLAKARRAAAAKGTRNDSRQPERGTHEAANADNYNARIPGTILGVRQDARVLGRELDCQGAKIAKKERNGERSSEQLAKAAFKNWTLARRQRRQAELLQGPERGLARRARSGTRGDEPGTNGGGVHT